MGLKHVQKKYPSVVSNIDLFGRVIFENKWILPMIFSANRHTVPHCSEITYHFLQLPDWQNLLLLNPRTTQYRGHLLPGSNARGCFIGFQRLHGTAPCRLTGILSLPTALRVPVLPLVDPRGRRRRRLSSIWAGDAFAGWLSNGPQRSAPGKVLLPTMHAWGNASSINAANTEFPWGQFFQQMGWPQINKTNQISLTQFRVEPSKFWIGKCNGLARLGIRVDFPTIYLVCPKRHKFPLGACCGTKNSAKVPWNQGRENRSWWGNVASSARRRRLIGGFQYFDTQSHHQNVQQYQKCRKTYSFLMVNLWDTTCTWCFLLDLMPVLNFPKPWLLIGKLPTK